MFRTRAPGIPFCTMGLEVANHPGHSAGAFPIKNLHFLPWTIVPESQLPDLGPVICGFAGVCIKNIVDLPPHASATATVSARKPFSYSNLEVARRKFEEKIA